MTQFLAEYGLFLLKVITILAAIIVVIVFAASAGRKASHEGLEVENLNKKFKSLADTLLAAGDFEQFFVKGPVPIPV